MKVFVREPQSYVADLVHQHRLETLRRSLIGRNDFNETFVVIERKNMTHNSVSRRSEKERNRITGVNKVKHRDQILFPSLPVAESLIANKRGANRRALNGTLPLQILDHETGENDGNRASQRMAADVKSFPAKV